MANELIDQLRPRDFCRLNGPVDDYDVAFSDSHAGLRLAKGDTSGFSFLVTVPPGLTQGTGWTFQFVTSDDGKNADDLGKVGVIGVTVKKLTSGTDTLAIASDAGTEQTATVTNDATTGQVVRTNLAVANANLDSTGAGDTALVRVRRVGSNASDTARGPLLLHYVNIFNT